jgi:septum formation protein
MTTLILASASAPRARLLKSAGVLFEVLPAGIDEEAVKAECRTGGKSASDTASRLADLKALKVASARPGRVVLGADQILEFDGQTVGKCATLAEAASLLVRLRGRTHELITAVTLAKGTEILWRHVARCQLVMRDFTDAFLSDYLSRAGVGILAVVGCYEVESLGAQLFERTDGDIFAILGLPLLPVLSALRRHGLIDK